LLIENKLSRIVYLNIGLNKQESHVALATQRYLEVEGYTKSQAIAIAISNVRTINSLHIKK
jgi:hypothetical protein